jgi:hypothetical protein
MFGKLQLYALIGAAFVLGLLGIYSAGISRGQDKVRRKIDASRISNLQTNKEISDEINSLDDPYLVQSARKWVRKD